MNRFTVKTLADCTDCVQLRHCNELGVMYCWISVENWGFCFSIAAYVHWSEDGDKSRLAAEVVVTLVGVLFLVWVAALAVFFYNIDKSYYDTFFDTLTKI